MIRGTIAFIRSFGRNALRTCDGCWVGPFMAASIAWSTARDAGRNWCKHEENLYLAQGIREPMNMREAIREWRARRRLNCRARALAKRETWFALNARCGNRRNRLNQFLRLLKEGECSYPVSLERAIITERWLVAEAELACDMRKEMETVK